MHLRSLWSVWILVGGLLACPALLVGGCESDPGAGSWRVSSPDDSLQATIRLDTTADSTALAYRVTLRDDGQETVLVPFSPLGIVRVDASFTRALQVQSVERQRIRDTYRLVHGKQEQVRAQARTLTLTVTNAAGERMEVTVRAYNDGVAYRYRFPGRSEQEHTVRREATGVRVPEGATGWLLPYSPPGKYAPSYERLFRAVTAGTPSPTGAGWGFPALFQIGEDGPWTLVTEAGLDAHYAGTHVAYDSTARGGPGTLYRIAFPNPGEGNGVGPVYPSSTLPWTTPWRVIIAGPDLEDIVESTLVTDVSAPVALDDTSWIEPGAVSWSWWSDGDSPTDPDALRDFVDLAADMTWQYSLIDAHWDALPRDTVRALADYADEREVGLFYWYNSGGEHNTIVENRTPRDQLNTPEQRQETFRRLRALGAAGIKVDFFNSDKQERIRHYLAILKDAAEHELLVNFHGSTIPRGWRRTYPNAMTMEAVEGGEKYRYRPDYPERAPTHNTILPFTRNVIGPMDYTPVIFSEARFPPRTTHGHELALSVVFQSSLQHFPDEVSAYRTLPDAPKQFLRRVPASWDETQFVGGHPGRHVVLARRNGKVWYVGGITAEEGRTVQVDLSFLPEGTPYRGTIIQDGADDESFSSRERMVESGGSIDVQMRPRGGFVARLVPSDKR